MGILTQVTQVVVILDNESFWSHLNGLGFSPLKEDFIMGILTRVT